MNDIPQEALRTIEEGFGARFVRHAAGEAGAEEPFASVFPESAGEVESLARLAARHRIPLMARGAGTALHAGKAPRAHVVRSRQRRLIFGAYPASGAAASESELERTLKESRGGPLDAAEAPGAPPAGEPVTVAPEDEPDTIAEADDAALQGTPAADEPAQGDTAQGDTPQDEK